MLLCDLLELVAFGLEGLFASAAVEFHLQLQLLKFLLHGLAVGVLEECVIFGLHVDALMQA